MNVTVFEAINITKKYRNTLALNQVSMSVMQGDIYGFIGENGAGKSTLLSLVCADNPQSYACDISLFGRKRGTGESIWEIKNTSVTSVLKCTVPISKICRPLRLWLPDCMTASVCTNARRKARWLPASGGWMCSALWL